MILKKITQRESQVTGSKICVNSQNFVDNVILSKIALHLNNCKHSVSVDSDTTARDFRSIVHSTVSPWAFVMRN